MISMTDFGLMHCECCENGAKKKFCVVIRGYGTWVRGVIHQVSKGKRARTLKPKGKNPMVWPEDFTLCAKHLREMLEKRGDEMIREGELIAENPSLVNSTYEEMLELRRELGDKTHVCGLFEGTPF